eukprot:3236644-Rhodomonas_salina.2
MVPCGTKLISPSPPSGVVARQFQRQPRSQQRFSLKSACVSARPVAQADCSANWSQSLSCAGKSRAEERRGPGKFKDGCSSSS